MASQGVQSEDIAALTDAIRSIKLDVPEPAQEPDDYEWEANWERDQRGLIESGVRFKKVSIQ